VRKSDVFACTFLKELLADGDLSNAEATRLFKDAFFNGNDVSGGKVPADALAMDEVAFRRLWRRVDELFEKDDGADEEEEGEDAEGEMEEDEEDEKDEDEDEDDEEGDAENDDAGQDDEYDDEYDDDEEEDEEEEEEEEASRGSNDDDARPEPDYDLGGLYVTARPPSPPGHSRRGARRSEL
jgi:Mg-chelatase subunit ChlI